MTWTGLRRQPFPEARQASAISEAMSSSGRRLKSFEFAYDLAAPRGNLPEKTNCRERR
jgi:hypothetical protein